MSPTFNDDLLHCSTNSHFLFDLTSISSILWLSLVMFISPYSYLANNFYLFFLFIRFLVLHDPLAYFFAFVSIPLYEAVLLYIGDKIYLKDLQFSNKTSVYFYVNISLHSWNQLGIKFVKINSHSDLILKSKSRKPSPIQSLRAFPVC